MADLDGECERLVVEGVLPADLVSRNRQIAEAALRPWTPVFTHGDLHSAHVFVVGGSGGGNSGSGSGSGGSGNGGNGGGEVVGIIDWSEAGRGDALYDLASLTVVHQEHLGDVVAGYGADVDLDVIRAWWSLRTLLVVRWLIDHGYDPFRPGGAVDVLRAQI